MTTADQLTPLFKPNSVAIIGASATPMKFPTWITSTALKSNFKGQTYLVNPKTKEIQGVKTYNSILDTPQNVDLAAIIVPADVVPSVMEECVEKSVKAAIIFSSGFREIGEKGIKREQEVLRIAKKGNIRIVGPNCMGIYSSEANLCLSLISFDQKGEVAFITQSGGYGIEISSSAMAKGINFSKFISVGDKIDIQDYEYLEYLYNDPDTKAIMMYIEGIEKGRQFLNTAKKITPKKPIFAIKIGRTKEGSIAASSHTGALAGHDAIYDAVFKQTGIIRAYDVEELFDYLKAYLTQPLPKGNRVGLLVGSGGVGCAATDKCAELSLQVPEISEQNKQMLKAILPEFASVRNPVDFTASGAQSLFTNTEVLKKLFTDPNIDSWFFGGFTSSSIAGIANIIEQFKPVIEKISSKDLLGEVKAPLVGSMDEKDIVKPIMERLFGAIFYPTPERAIRALSALHRYGKYLEKNKQA
nr:CoA-binding protein [Candidatus Freyarchaeota archaeon]